MKRSTNRREFLEQLALGAGGIFAAPSIARASELQSQPTGWNLVPTILKRIKPPKFPSRDFSITSYGAKGDGAFDCTMAFRRAITECAGRGGGRVVVPEGRFLTGPIHLANNVNLHLDSDATILFSRDAKKYLPAVLTRFEGVEVMNYSPLI